MLIPYIQLRGPDGRGLSTLILETPLFQSLDLTFCQRCSASESCFIIETSPLP